MNPQTADVSAQHLPENALSTSNESLRRRFVGLLFRPTIARAKAAQVMDGALPMTGIHRILICRPNHRLGNMLLLTPLIRALETVYPGAEVDLLIGSKAGDVIFSGFARVRRIHCLTARMARHPLLLWRTVRQLRKIRYDLVINAGRGSQSGHILSGMIGGRFLLSAQPAGDTAQREHFGHIPVHALARALAIGTPLSRPYPELSIPLMLNEKQQGRRILDALVRHQPASADGVVGVFANATGNKRHSLEWWQRFLDQLQQQRPGLRVIEFLPAYGQSPLQCRLPAFFSTDIRAMAALAAQCACFVSADCGVMHLASASGATTFGLFSSTSPDLYGPFGHHSRAFVTARSTPEQIAHAVIDHLDSRLDYNGRRQTDAVQQAD